MHWRQYQELQKVSEIGERFLSYVEAGGGPPVVLLHGAPTWGYLFHRLVPILERRRRVLVPDLPGYGFSDRSDRFSRSGARQAERLCAWLQSIGLERACFVGHDLGAALAMRMAVCHPERVERLVLMDAAAYDSWPPSFLHELGHPSSFKRWTPAAMQKKLSKALAPGFSRPEPDLLAGLLAPYASETGALSLVRDCSALDCSETMELIPYLAHLQAPSLVLWGEADRIQPLDVGRRLAWELPHSRLAVMPNAGHYGVLENPADVAGLLMQFLETPLQSLIGRSPTSPAAGPL